MLHRGQHWLYPQAFALDSQGFPHIGYDASASTLGYVYKNATGWHYEGVSSGGTTGFYEAYVSLALDSSDRPHLGFYNGTDKNAQYGYRDDAGWHIRIVESTGTAISKQLTLALSNQGLPRILYGHVQHGLKYAVAVPPAYNHFVFLPIVRR